MITEPTVYSDDRENSASLLDQELNFASIDGPIIHWTQRFPISMLRAGRIILKDEFEVMNVPPERISRIMSNPKNDIPNYYSPLQIRQELYKHWGEIRGGGIKVEWTQTANHRYRSVPHYDFTFSQILRPEDYMIPEAPNERV
jgi:hypothetical protein